MKKFISSVVAGAALFAGSAAHADRVSVSSNNTYASFSAYPESGDYFQFYFASAYVSVYGYDYSTSRSFSCSIYSNAAMYDDLRLAALAFVNSDSRDYVPSFSINRDSSYNCSSFSYSHYR